MIYFTKNVRFSFPILDVSTRAKRRKALNIVLLELERIRAAEDHYLSHMPLNLHDSKTYCSADYTVDLLTDAIITLGDAF
jgi:hypothetical protein